MLQLLAPHGQPKGDLGNNPDRLRMNIIRTNSDIDLIWSLAQKSLRAGNTPTLKEINQAPLLTLSIENEISRGDAHRWIKQYKGEDLPVPFPVFRCAIAAAGEDGMFLGFAWAKTFEEGKIGITAVIGRERGMHCFGDHVVCELKSTGLRCARASSETNYWLEEFADPAEKVGIYTVAITLLYFYSDPAVHAATVRPDVMGKSVEWVRKRSYMTVVERCHPANSAQVGNGQTVVQTESTIKRCAHHRRAHYRILRSERWGKSQGKRIRVRSAWVGPQEWREGNQIYTIKR